MLACCGGMIARADMAKVDFVKDIQPILQESCVKCHGPEKHKGDLRLDTKEGTFKGGKDGQVIVPEHADKSDLYRRVTLPEGSDDIMPSKGSPLTKKQTDLIKDWINQGATWPEGAIVKAVEEAPTASSSPNDIFAGLTPMKPTAAETGAIAKLGSSGIDVRPVAMNLNWRVASFRSMGTNATDAAIAPLKDILDLVDLNLGGTKITDAGLQNIAKLTNLISLHLELTGITDKGLAHLKHLDHLAYLNLYGTSVTDKGLDDLKSLHNLKHLYLWQTKVTAQGAADLQKALPSVAISRGWENEPAAKDAEEKEKKEKKETKGSAPAAKKEAKK
ncbi:MAG TPA: c-type cytochrome domain-containing protein [Verrucomicrobiae bacterium]|nr:c-type cytochrome domain-containing protein [Verrucomicrobiae bacterium]